MFTTVLRCLNAVWLLVAASLASAQTLNDPVLRVTEVVAGLNMPTTMAFIGPSDILVLQKDDGLVRRVIDGVLQPAPVLDVAVDNASERGLLGIAIHPAFPTTPLVYLYYTESSSGVDTTGSPPPVGNRIYRFTWNGSALIDPTLILDLPVTTGPNHDGGFISFGPDGKLYAVIGDLNRRGQLQNIATGLAPDDTSVILRLNDDGTTPPDNPFFALGGNLAKYYAYGIRNSFGLAFDPLTNKLWMTENGPSSYDEINLVDPGFNSGWVQLMGPAARNTQGLDALVQFPGSHYRDPAFSWFKTVAPTGIVFLNSLQLGMAYQNHVFIGDDNYGNLYHFTPNASRDGFIFQNPGLADLVADSDDELQEVILGTGFGAITDLKVGPDGRLYVLSIAHGKIYAIASAPATLQGVVTDGTTGVALAGVKVRARLIGADPAVRADTSTNASGAYILRDLIPGRYRVLFSRSGYQPQRGQVGLIAEEPVTANVQLQPR
jgi:glucose/arabinose dehydrogenase